MIYAVLELINLATVAQTCDTAVTERVASTPTGGGDEIMSVGTTVGSGDASSVSSN